MGVHDSYGKNLLKNLAGEAFASIDESVYFPFGEDGGTAGIDGTVGKEVAVEIESRTDKQIRGALLDLILHPFPKKLLLVLPGHMHSVNMTVAQCNYILGRFLEQENYRVVLLQGHGHDPKVEIDKMIIGQALKELGFHI